ncbi:MAG: molybdenum cofactor biosynthesis protein MoaE [Rhodothalassiaceae bacterium]
MAEVRVQEQAFDPAAEQRAGAIGPDVGAVLTFVGHVRGSEGVEEMILEHYPGMTEREIARIASEAERRWPLLGCRIVHRYGRMRPGEPIVLVRTAAAHRKAAFEAAEFLIDWLKTRAPFWKCEITAAGRRWVEARESDDRAAARWQEEPPR